MVARLFPAADFTIDPGVDEPCRGGGTQEQMIDPQPGVASISISEVVPKGVDTLVRVQLTHGIGPAK